MARTIWTGTLSFGLVNVPVRLYSATEDHSPRFHQFVEGTSDRVRYKRVNERTGKEVGYSDIVKGAETGDGEAVLISQDELDAVGPGRPRTIEVSDFVEEAEIDPIFYQKTYYLGPNGEDATKPYALLREAMHRAGRVGIATFVMRGREYLAAVRPDQEVLALETMLFADEVRDPEKEVDRLPAKASGGREFDSALELIESMTTAWQPDRYTNTYREQVDALVEAKRKGEETVTEREAPQQTNVVDLTEALNASIERAKGSGDQKSSAPRRGARSKPSATDADLTDMDKKELSQLASRLDISGRSKMNRAQLEDAIHQARTGSGGKKKAS